MSNSRFSLHAYILVATFFLLSYSGNSCAQQPWSGILAPARAANWTNAGLPGDMPPDSAWPQCGSTIAAYGSSASYASPSTIQNAINACGTNQYVFLGAGDFYLTSGVHLKSNMVVRGSGANQTRIHVASGDSCNGLGSVICLSGANVYGGECNLSAHWNCPAGQFSPGYSYFANWTAGYSQGATSITLDNVAGMVVNQTILVLDQCDTGLSGISGDEGCIGGTGGVITAASVYSGGGGSGYSVGDNGTINCTEGQGTCFGDGTAAYHVTSVSGGAVTGFTVTAGGHGYTYTFTNSPGSPTTTTKTSGSGSGLEVQITGISSYDNGSITNGSVTGVTANESSGGSSRPARTQTEVFIPTSISGSGPYTVTLNHPLIHPNWASGQNPQAMWTSGAITNAGVENLLIDANGNQLFGINAQNAHNVWITGIASKDAYFYHVDVQWATQVLVSNSYFYGAYSSGSESYGIGGVLDSNSLFENNIAQQIVTPLLADGGCSGCVYGYNYAINSGYVNTTFVLASDDTHASAADYILWEGNYGRAMSNDNVHGPAFFNTFFRNYSTGYESVNGAAMPTSTTTPMAVGAFARYNNFLANVLGTPGYHTAYQCVPASSSTSVCASPNAAIWDIGWSDSEHIDNTNLPPEPNDLTTNTSLYRYGNYDVVNNAAQWKSSEVPTSDPNFPNFAPASNAFPSSFYTGVVGAFSSCGTGLNFWKNPTTGLCPEYPAIGPDVTGGDIGMCTSGAYKWARALTASQCAGGGFTASVSGGYGNSNPAMRCYLNQMGGPPDGTGSMLTFNAAACYAADSGPVSGHGPALPTGLTAVPIVTN
jgi:hypothetical protein